MTTVATSAYARMREASALWASSIGIKTIWADQDGVRPASPYATLKLSGFAAVHEDALEDPDTTGHRHITGTRECVLTVQVFGKTAIALANRLAMSSHLPQPAMDALGVCIVDLEQLEDVSKLMEDAIEPRAVLDVVLRASSDVEDNNSLIGSVTATSEVGPVASVLNIN